MIDFWLAVALFLVLAAAFLCAPWLLSRKSGILIEREGRREQNVRIYRERLAELDADLSAGRIEDTDYERLKEELGTSLLEDVEGLEQTAAMSAGDKLLRPLTLVLVLTLPVAAYLFYGKWGAYDELELARSMVQSAPHAQQSTAAAGNGQDMNQLMNQLAERLKADPDNAEGWFLLGRTYMNFQNYAEAEQAFQQLIGALERQNENPAVGYGMLAQARYFSQGQPTPEVMQTIDKALELDPQETNALGLKGIIAFEQGEYETAVSAWQGYLAVMAPDAPNRGAIEQAVAEAQRRAAGGVADTVPAVAAGEPATAPSPGPASLTVAVELSPEVAAQAVASDTLFVYARAVNGPRMPLAISRQVAGSLPLTVTLDDSMAMGPMAKLSSVEEVEVIARISKSGTPAPNPGDLEGIVTPVMVNGNQDVIRVVINRAIP